MKKESDPICTARPGEEQIRPFPYDPSVIRVPSYKLLRRLSPARIPIDLDPV